MSKTNSKSRNVREPRERELRDNELALVSGGAIYMRWTDQMTDDTSLVWVGCAYVPQSYLLQGL